MPVDPERVLVTSGTSPAMLLVFSLLVEPGDEVVLGTPHYPCYPNFVRVCGGTPVLRADRGRGRLSRSTRTPCAARSRRARARSSWARPRTRPARSRAARRSPRWPALGPPIVSDEIYDGLVYDGAAACSALELGEDVYVLDGFSKRYAMTGFRLGWLIAPPRALRPLQAMQQNLFISANRFVQHAGLAALRAGRADGRRRCARPTRGGVSSWSRACASSASGARAPRGAFYVFADARDFGTDSLRLAFLLLERAQVGAAPGIDFGAAGEGWLRFCYAASEAAIEEALARLARVLPTLR